eukprot:CAMPEP_0118956058 /NCGR_PEP_ID=MMETSP1169-20130426/60998_1 /TAXON_ID=36882 /ORGANISM="Pyramimonas obovata, Strain CCMP722" /LENGTH=404 /DNA_ID=CAMNT_0006904015 /DNA_START=113 /DNA_END=1323 /DNA_ORIENTATION=+
MSSWSVWLGGIRDKLERAHLLRSLRPITNVSTSPASVSSVEVILSDATLQRWLSNAPSAGEEGGVPPPVEENGVDTTIIRTRAIEQNTRAGSRWHSIRLFSTNDYLGLSAHQEVLDAVARTVLSQGMGPRASALVAGYTHLHRELETALAQLKETEDCLLCPSGFSANTATISTLCTKFGNDKVAIFSDELNHASIVDGARLSKSSSTELHIYRHNDVQHLEQLLEASNADRKLVVTDTIFSMDGDMAPLADLARLKKRYGFLLVVDEAHATLVCGHNGGGAVQQAGVARDVDVHIGTLSKAFGSLGGFIACSREMKQVLLTKGRAFVYSTALPVPVVAGALAALRVATRDPTHRERLWARVRQLGRALGRPLASPIVALVIGGEEQALAISQELLRRGFHVPA